MDNIGWDGSEFEANTPIIMLRTQEQDLEGGYNISNISSSFHNNQIQEMQKVQTGYTYPNSEKLIYYQSEASTTSEVMNEIQSINLLQHAATMREGLTSQSLFHSFGVNNYMQDFNTAQQFIINGTQQNGKSACSLDSFDCLFSATNSNTETCVEDADFKNIWNNFKYGSADSCGELSECNSSNDRRNKNMQCPPINEFDETLESINKANCSKRSNNDKSDYMFKAGTNYFKLISENSQKSKKPRWEKSPYSSNINFQKPNSSASSYIEESDPEAIAQMKEMIYRAATFRPVNLGLENVEKPKRKNVRISSDPQTVAARQRRERISDKIRVLQNMVPGGSKMDTASMLDEAANYLKYLRSQVKAMENLGNKVDTIAFSFNPSFPMQTSLTYPSLAGFEA